MLYHFKSREMAIRMKSKAEEQIKNEVGKMLFSKYDTTEIIGKIDFSVSAPISDTNQLSIFGDKKEYFLWAEAKAGNKADIKESFVQLILTIGKAKTYNDYAPPVFLGAFDAEKIAFLEYSSVTDIFYQSDFNWNVRPSDHTSKEFVEMYQLVEKNLNDSWLFYYNKDSNELDKFIKDNFKLGLSGLSKIQINTRNFTYVYQRWLHDVMPSINIDWDVAKKLNIIYVDFYLADLLSRDNNSLYDSLFVLLKTSKYVYDIKDNTFGGQQFLTASFNDNQKAYNDFWKIYERPPKKVFWGYILERRDLLVPKDIRERKGAFFTPQHWAKLSKRYIADVLGEDWQNEYYIWDCCAGTGNLLEGLVNTRNLFASTLDIQDVKIMKQRILADKLNLYENQVFQFDFLNDKLPSLNDNATAISESKIPKQLREILLDENKRKKLIIYINPPYAEATTASTATGTGSNKSGVANNNNTYNKYKTILKKASYELYAQFLIRIKNEIPSCIIANFCTLKILLGPNFIDFRKNFNVELCKMFIVPANTFDNVKGEFPIGFYIWRTSNSEVFKEITADVYDRNYHKSCKTLICPDNKKTINQWIAKYSGEKRFNPNTNYGTLFYRGNDFQNQKYIYIGYGESVAHDSRLYFNQSNLLVGCVYLAVRQCIEHTWLNDRDQFYEPKDTWETDTEFQTDCLAYVLFHGQNKISCENGINHWIPFTEKELGIKTGLDSHFISDFIRGKSMKDAQQTMFSTQQFSQIVFSPEARALWEAGLALWKYYLSQSDANYNASFYDIRSYFQGTDDKGKMNNFSDDETYNKLLNEIRIKRNTLGEKIQKGVFKHCFLQG